MAPSLIESSLAAGTNIVQSTVGMMLMNSLNVNNFFWAAAKSGAKGNDNNITQITSMLGQQNLEGKRMPMAFGNRSLPHFAKKLAEIISKSESSTTQMLETLFASRGFVHSGFYKGLTPTDFFFHAVGGREGLIDTACRTATTGYAQRKMVKLLEDLQITYRGTVEDASRHIISFDYGGDNFDGSKIIYRNGDPLFVDIESVCNKLNADYEWEMYNKKINSVKHIEEERVIEVIEEEKEEKIVEKVEKKVKKSKEVQKHGFEWEKDILTNVYGASMKELEKINYTNSIDLPSKLNKLDDANISIKTSGNGNVVCMSDCLRVYDFVNSGENNHLVVVFYEQDDDNDLKKLNSIVEIDLTNSCELYKIG
jgi:DNA-directed RNA polymerase II subunit RPB1